MKLFVMDRVITLHPSRIGCPSLPGTMKGIICSIKGVKQVVVRYEDRSLDITFNDAETSVEKIIATIGKELGLSLEAAEERGRGEAAETCPM